MSIKPKKSLGQHFLTDSNIIRKIVDSVRCAPDGNVVEIGPGTGAVTEPLLERFPSLEVIEIDERAVDFLQATYPKLKIHQQDVLKTSWQSMFQREGEAERPISVVGNLPYYITSPILFSVIDERSLFTEAIFMMQKEVAERLTAKTRTKDYGILSVQTQIWSRPEYLFTVSRHVFNPKPNVESAVVRLTFDTPDPGVDPVFLKVLIRTAFNQRRKTLSNSIKSILLDTFPKESDPDGAKRTQFSLENGLHRRAEELEPSEFIDLAKAFLRQAS